MTIIGANTTQIIQGNELIQAQLAGVGIKAVVDTKEMAIATTSFFEQESHNIFSNSWGTNRVDPHLTPATTFVSGGYCFPDKKDKRPQLDQLGAKGDATFDTQERKKIYNRSRDYLSNQMFFLSLFSGSYYEGYNKKVQNMSTFHDAGAYAYYAHLWLKK